MPKTKQQKQQEAIERKRSNFLRAITEWRTHQPTGRLYEHELSHYGKAAAQEMASRAEKFFVRYLQEAHVDRHGNPLNEGILHKGKWVTSPVHPIGKGT